MTIAATAPPKFEKKQERTLTFARGAIDEEARTVEVAFSSEMPVERMFGIEILDHSEGAVDLSRLNDKAAVLKNHNPDNQIGVVERAWIDGDRVGRATLRFSRNAEGEAEWQDIRDGIRTKISVGYILTDEGTRDETRDRDGLKAYRFRSLPYEISPVSIPADNSVGVGRNKQTGEPTPEQKDTMPTKAPEKEVGETPKENIRAADAGTVTADPETRSRVEVSVEDVERKIEARHAGIDKLGSLWGIPAAELQRAKRERTSIEDFQRMISNKEIEIPSAAPQFASALDMSEKEKRSYSFISALRDLSNGEKVGGFEREISDEISERCGRDTEGFFIPSPGELMPGRGSGRRDLTAGTTTDGEEIVSTDTHSDKFIDILRPNMTALQLGVRVLTGLKGNVEIPRKTTAGTATWAGDEVTTAFSESDLQLDTVNLSPQHLGFITDVSKTLLVQSDPSAEMLVRDDMNGSIAVGLDQSVFRGSGSGEPQGIDGATGVGTSTIAVPGAPTLAELIEFITDVDTGNALTGNLAWVTTPAVRGTMMGTLMTAAVSGYQWNHESNTVLGYGAHSTAQADTNDIFFGNWTDYILGLFDGIDITVDRVTQAPNRICRFIVGLMADGDVRRPQSFCTNA